MNITLEGESPVNIPIYNIDCNHTRESIYIGDFFPTGEKRNIPFQGEIFTSEGNLFDGSVIKAPCIDFEEIHTRETRAILIIFLFAITGVSFTVLWEFYKVFIEKLHKETPLNL